MLFVDGGFALLFIALWLFCIIDVITTPEGLCRNLPKLIWLMIVIILPDLGSIAWLVAGRPWTERAAQRAARPATPRRPARASNPDDDEEFLAQLRARAEEQRRRAREAQERDDGPADGNTPA